MMSLITWYPGHALVLLCLFHLSKLFVQTQDVESLGCWKDLRKKRALISMEHKNHLLNGPYSKRSDPVKKCAQVAIDHGYSIFAVQNGGQCFSGSKGEKRYDMYGPSNLCINGTGGKWSNSVYSTKTSHIRSVHKAIDPSPWDAYCSRDLDIVLLLDSSGTVSKKNKERWKEMKKFCWKFMKGFDEHARFGVIRYGSDPDIIVDLVKAKGQEQITEELKSLDMSGGKRTLNDGLKRAWREQLKENNRSAADKVIIAMTTGDVPYGLYGSSQFLSDHGVRVIAIGVDKNVHYEFLQSIASYRDVSNIFSVNSEQLQEVAPFIYRDVCNTMPEYVSETTTTPAPPKADEPTKNSTLNETMTTNSTSDKPQEKVNNTTSSENEQKNSTDAATSNLHNENNSTANTTGTHRHEIPTNDKPTEAPFPSAIDETTGSKKTILPKHSNKKTPNGSTRKNVVTAIKNGATKEEVATMVLVNPSPELNLFITDSEVNEINNRRGTAEGKLKSIMVHSNETLQKLKASENSSSLYNDDNAKNLNETNLNPDLNHNQNVFSDLENNIKTSPSNTSTSGSKDPTNAKVDDDKKKEEMVNGTSADESLSNKKIQSDKDFSVFDNMKENRLGDDKDENLLSSVKPDNHLDEDTLESINAPSLPVLDNSEPTQDFSKHKALKAIDTSSHNKDISKGTKINGSVGKTGNASIENDQDSNHPESLGAIKLIAKQKNESKSDENLKKYSSQTIEGFSSDEQSKLDEEPQPLLEAPKKQGALADAKTFDIPDEGKAADSKIVGPGIVSQTLELHQGNGKEHVSEHPQKHVDLKNLFSGKLSDRWKSHEIKSMKPMFSDRAKIVDESQHPDPKLEFKNITGWRNATTLLDSAGKELAEIYHKVHDGKITNDQTTSQANPQTLNANTTLHHLMGSQPYISKFSGDNNNNAVTPLRSPPLRPSVEIPPIGPSVFEMDEDQQPDRNLVRNVTAQNIEVKPTSSTEAVKDIYNALQINPHNDKLPSHFNIQTPLIKPQLINTSEAIQPTTFNVPSVSNKGTGLINNFNAKSAAETFGSSARSDNNNIQTPLIKPQLMNTSEAIHPTTFNLQSNSNKDTGLINNFNAKAASETFGSSVRSDNNNKFITLNLPDDNSNQGLRNISNQVLSDTKNLLRNNLAVDLDAFHQDVQQNGGVQQNGVEANAKTADRSTKKHELKMDEKGFSNTTDVYQSNDIPSMKSLVGAVEQVSKNAAVLAAEENHSLPDEKVINSYSNVHSGPAYEYDDDQLNDEQTRKMLQERKEEIDRLLKLLDAEDKKRLTGQVRSTNRHTIEPKVLTAEAKELRKAFDQINKRIRSLHDKKQRFAFESDKNTIVYHEPTLSYYTAPSHYGDFGDFQRPITGRINLGGGSIPFVSEEIGSSLAPADSPVYGGYQTGQLHASQYQNHASKKFERQNPDINANDVYTSQTSNKKTTEIDKDDTSTGKNKITDTERSNHYLLKFKPAIIPSESSASVSSVQRTENQTPKVSALTFSNRNEEKGEFSSNGNTNVKKLPSTKVKASRINNERQNKKNEGFKKGVNNEENNKVLSKNKDQSDKQMSGTGKDNAQKTKSNFARKENNNEKTKKIIANKDNDSEKTKKVGEKKENDIENSKKVIANKDRNAEKNKKFSANKENSKDIGRNMTKTNGNSSQRIKTTALTIEVDNIEEARERKKKKLLKSYTDHVNKIILNRTKLFNKQESESKNGSDISPSSLSKSKHNKNILQRINSLVASLEPEDDDDDADGKVGNRKHMEEKEKKVNKTSNLNAREKTSRQPQYQYYFRDPNALRSVYPSPSRPLTPFNMSKLPFSNPGSYFTSVWNSNGMPLPDLTTSSYASSRAKNIINPAGPSIGAFTNEEITRNGNIVNSFIKNKYHPLVNAYKDVTSINKLSDPSNDITSKYQHLNLNTLSRKSKAPKLKKRKYDKPFPPDIPSAQETAALQMKPIGAIKPPMNKHARPPMKPHHPKDFDSLFEHVRKEKISNKQRYEKSKEKSVSGVKKSTNSTTPFSKTLQWARMEIAAQNSNDNKRNANSRVGSWTERDFTAKVDVPLSRDSQGNIKTGKTSKLNKTIDQGNAKGGKKLMNTFRKLLLASAASSEKEKNRKKLKHEQKKIKAAIRNYDILNSKLKQIKDTLSVDDSLVSSTDRKAFAFKGIPKHVSKSTTVTDSLHTNQKEDDAVEQTSKKRFLGMANVGNTYPVTERDVYNVPSYWNSVKNFYAPAKAMNNVGHTINSKGNVQVTGNNAFSQVANELYRVRKLYDSRRQSAEAKMNSEDGKKGKKISKIKTDSAKKESINTNTKDVDLLNLDNDKIESNWKELITGNLDKDLVTEDETFNKQEDTTLSFTKPNKNKPHRYYATPSMSKQILKTRLKMNRLDGNVIRESDFPRKFSINEFRLSDLPALPKGKSYVLSTPSLGTVLVKIHDDLDEDVTQLTESEAVRRPIHARNHHQTLLDLQKSAANEKTFFPSNKNIYLNEHQFDSENKAIEGKKIPSLVSYVGNSVSRHRNMTDDSSFAQQNEDSPVISGAKDPLTGIFKSGKSFGNVEHDTVDFSKTDTYDNLEESLIRDRSQKLHSSLLPTGKRSHSIFYDDSNISPHSHNEVSEMENEGLINMVHSVLKESPEESKNFLKHKGNGHSILSQAFGSHDNSVTPTNETGLSLLIQKIHSLNKQINEANNHSKTSVGNAHNRLHDLTVAQDETGLESKVDTPFHKVNTPFHKDNSHQLDSDENTDLTKSTKSEEMEHKPLKHLEEDKLTRIFESDTTTEPSPEEVTPLPDNDMMGLTVNQTVTNKTQNFHQVGNKTKGISSENMTKQFDLGDTKPVKMSNKINVDSKNLTSKINSTESKQNTSSNSTVIHSPMKLDNFTASKNSSIPGNTTVDNTSVGNQTTSNLTQNATLKEDIKENVTMANSTNTVNKTEDVKTQNATNTKANVLQNINASQPINATADMNDTTSMSSLEYTLGCSKPLRILYAIDVSDGLGAGPLRKKRWKRLRGFINDINNDVIPGVRHSFMVYNVEPRFLKGLETCDKDTEYFMTADECLCSRKVSLPNAPGCSVNNPTETENVEDWGRSGPRTGQALERARKKFFGEDLHSFKNVIFLISHKDSVDSLDKPENDLKQDGISLVDIELGDRHDLKRKRDFIAHAHLKNTKKSTIGDSNNTNDDHKMKVSLKKLQTTLRNIVEKVCKANTDDDAKKKSIVHNED